LNWEHSSRDLDFATRDDVPAAGDRRACPGAFQAAGYNVALVERPADTLAWRLGCPVPNVRRHWRWMLNEALDPGFVTVR
jgi:hypothetical protein